MHFSSNEKGSQKLRHMQVAFHYASISVPVFNLTSQVSQKPKILMIKHETEYLTRCGLLTHIV